MKCIADKNGNIERVSDSEADEKVATGKWSFTSKSNWKKSQKAA